MKRSFFMWIGSEVLLRRILRQLLTFVLKRAVQALSAFRAQVSDLISADGGVVGQVVRDAAERGILSGSFSAVCGLSRREKPATY